MSIDFTLREAVSMSDIGKIDPNLAVSGTIGDTQVLFYNVIPSVKQFSINTPFS